jgi:hypothetical protein
MTLRKRRLVPGSRADRRSDGYLGAHVGRDVVAAYALEAKRRGMPLSRLVAKVLRCVVNGKLIDAVVDED